MYETLAAQSIATYHFAVQVSSLSPYILRALVVVVVVVAFASAAFRKRMQSASTQGLVCG